MIGEKVYHSIVTLSKLGKSQREIAELLSISKTTVNRYLNIDYHNVTVGKSHRKGQSNFNVCEEYVCERLSKYPRLRSSVLYKNVKSKFPAITCKPRAFRSFIRKIKNEHPSTKHRPYAIIETEAGQQVQVDPGEMKICLGTNPRQRVFFIVFILSHSRQIYVHWSLTPYKTGSFIDAHREAFIYFEGIPVECVYDQTKLVVIQERYREVILNNQFHQFALKAGYHPHVCEGYDPQSKGKVERNVSEVKHDFLYGTEFSDLADLRSRGLEWLVHYNGRTHSVTGKVPSKAWEEEKLTLKAIPDYVIVLALRNADKTGLISYEGNKYSVPLEYQRKQVYVQKDDGYLVITNIYTREVLCKHKISSEKGKIIKNNNHYRDYSVVLEELKKRVEVEMDQYEQGKELVQRLVDENPKIARDQLRALGKFYRNYEADVWDSVLPEIMTLSHVKATVIEKLLNTRVRQLKFENLSKPEEGKNADNSIIERSLNDYMKVIEDDRYD